MQQIALAAGLGLLVGLQREWADKAVGGLRTFTLVAVFGALCGLLSPEFGGWIVAAGLLSVTTLFVLSNLSSLRADRPHPGITTEAAGLVLFALGAALTLGHVVPALVVTGGMVVLLQWKEPLHTGVRRLAAADMRAILRLVLVALVILPVLPDRAYGPFGALNPFRIWTMVVLIVGISLAAYIASRLLGGRRGVLVGGFLGGLISSTATTFSQARQRDRARAAALVILAAAVVAFLRILGEIVVVGASVLPVLAPPLLIVTGVLAAWVLILLVRFGKEDSSPVAPSDTTSMRTAIVFGLLYGGVLFAVAAAREQLGSGALYGIAALSGLLDMDAITLSTTHLAQDGSLEASTAWRLIMVAAMANLVFKGSVVAVLGGWEMARYVTGPFLATLLAAGTVLCWWPG